jgi:hypothetical protein
MREFLIFFCYTAVFPIYFFFRTGAKRSTFNWFLLIFTVISITADSLNYFLGNFQINNLFVINFYQYFSIVFELGFIVTALNFSRKFKVFSSLLIVFYWLVHLQYNIEHGFLTLANNSAYLNALTVCVYCVVGIIKVVFSDSHSFKQSKHLLLPLFGFFVFEAACSIPLGVFYYPMELSSQEKYSIATFFNCAMLVGQVTRNILISYYFVLDERKHKVL